jgi:hypothetical protein
MELDLHLVCTAPLKPRDAAPGLREGILKLREMLLVIDLWQLCCFECVKQAASCPRCKAMRRDILAVDYFNIHKLGQRFRPDRGTIKNDRLPRMRRAHLLDIRDGREFKACENDALIPE